MPKEQVTNRQNLSASRNFGRWYLIYCFPQSANEDQSIKPVHELLPRSIVRIRKSLKRWLRRHKPCLKIQPIILQLGNVGNHLVPPTEEIGTSPPHQKETLNTEMLPSQPPKRKTDFPSNSKLFGCAVSQVGGGEESVGRRELFANFGKCVGTAALTNRTFPDVLGDAIPGPSDQPRLGNDVPRNVGGLSRGQGPMWDPG
jgi:hypothetical protein